MRPWMHRSAGLAAGALVLSATASHAAQDITANAQPDAAMIRCIGSAAAWQERDEVEPHVAVSPNDADHVVASWMVRVPGQPGAIQAAVSRDGGRTWSNPRTLAFGTCAGGPEGLRFASDPWASIGPDNRVYLSAIGFSDDDTQSNLLVVTSPDGGANWSAATTVSSRAVHGVAHDNTAVVAAPDVAGLAYLTTTRYGPDSAPIGFARTEDGGRTWTQLATLQLPEVINPIGFMPQPLAGRNGAVRVVFSTPPRGSRVFTMTSTDRGNSWTDAIEVASWPWAAPPMLPGTEKQMNVAPDIVHAVQNSTGSEVWIVHPSADSSGKYGVSLAHSVDAGRTWARTRLNDAAHTAWRPTIGITRNGAVGAYWYRDDGAPSDTVALPTAVDFAWLNTPGAAPATIDRFTWRPRRTGEFFLGDYHGLVMTNDAALAVYARTGAERVRVRAQRVAFPAGVR